VEEEGGEDGVVNDADERPSSDGRRRREDGP
jgi:hypothetical protein